MNYLQTCKHLLISPFFRFFQNVVFTEFSLDVWFPKIINLRAYGAGPFQRPETGSWPYISLDRPGPARPAPYLVTSPTSRGSRQTKSRTPSWQALSPPPPRRRAPPPADASSPPRTNSSSPTTRIYRDGVGWRSPIWVRW